jgi:hypothetical protein
LPPKWSKNDNVNISNKFVENVAELKYLGMRLWKEKE